MVLQEGEHLTVQALCDFLFGQAVADECRSRSSSATRSRRRDNGRIMKERALMAEEKIKSERPA